MVVYHAGHGLASGGPGHSLLTSLSYSLVMAMTERLVMDKLKFTNKEMTSATTKVPLLTWREIEAGFSNLGIQFKPETTKIQPSLEGLEFCGFEISRWVELEDYIHEVGHGVSEVNNAQTHWLRLKTVHMEEYIFR